MLHKSTGSPGNDIYLIKNSSAIEIVLRSPYNVGVFSGAGIPQTSSANLPGCPMEQHIGEAGLAPHHRPRHHLLVQLEEDRS